MPGCGCVCVRMHACLCKKRVSTANLKSFQHIYFFCLVLFFVSFCFKCVAPGNNYTHMYIQLKLFFNFLLLFIFNCLKQQQQQQHEEYRKVKCAIAANQSEV